MKKVIIFALIPLVFAFCKSKKENGNVIEKWDNGNPKITKEITDKANNSFISIEFYRDGNLKSKVTFKQGKIEGTSKYFDEDGYLSSEKKYKNGILFTEYTYKFGKLSGPEKLWHYNGQLWTERILYDGKPWEVVSNFDSTGVAMDKGTLKNGDGTIKLYDKKGILLEVRTYRGGKEVVNK